MSRKHSYLANSYLKVLDYKLLICQVLGLVFIQGSASIHIAHKVCNQFKEIGILVTSQPLYSPNLNLIEHVQKKLKERVLKKHLEISDIKGKENIREALGKALQEAQDSIPKEFFDRLIESMPSRVKAVIKAKGWHTKY